MSGLRVRYWAAARDAAQLESETVEATTLAGVLEAVRMRHDERFATVLGASSLLLDGVAVGRRDPEEVEVADGMTLEVLPPFAGG